MYESDKRICLCGVRGEERYNHQQSFTTVSRQGHIVVKVLALWYKIRIKIFRKYVESNHEGHVKFMNIVWFH